MERDGLLDALGSIDPATLEYSEFVEIGMALKHEGLPFEAWDAWAARDAARYKGTLRRKWDGFSDANAAGAPVTGGTLVQAARDRGWEPPRDMGEAMGWDDSEVSASPERGAPRPRVVDPTWVEGAEIEEPGEGWEGWRDLAAYLEAVFDPEEIVGYVTEAWYDDDKEKWLPSKKGSHDRTAAELLRALDKYGGDLDAALGRPSPEAGAWIRFNPLDGGGVRNDNVAEFRHALVESDSLPVDKQVAIIRELRLPVTALVSSGGKSAHAVVRVDAKDYDEYRRRVDELYRICRENGLAVDTQNKNPSRLSRMPGVMRGGRRQWLMGLRLGCESWAEWREWYDEQTDDLPDPESLADVWDDLPELSPPLIGGVLRQGHKMLLAGPSKAGKSYALIELCVALAEGVPWLGFPVEARGRVLYVNLELDRASCLHRFRDVYRAMGAEPAHVADIDVWNLRGKSKPMDELAPALIRRALKTRPIAVVIDPIYKVITGDENSADQMAAFCNQFDKVADALGCAVVYCHHHSKGLQGGKRSMDRASGSGVFARDPDALLDMIELHVTEDCSKAAAGAAAVRACADFMDSLPQLEGWRDIVEPDAQLAEWPMIEAARELCRPSGNEGALMGAVEAARARALAMTAWRVEGTLREFPRFEPVNLWFEHPAHVRDATGALSDLFAEGDTSPEAVADAKARGTRATKERASKGQRSKVKAMREALDECGREGVKPTRDRMAEKVQRILGEELPASGLKNWTRSTAKWSPIRARQDEEGTWVLYDAELEPMLAGFGEEAGEGV